MTAELGRALQTVDHLVYAVPDLDAAVERLAGLLGVRAAPGGRHAGRGTHNALLALGPTAYLEIIAPDPDQPPPPGPRWFGIDALSGPRLVGWAARADRLEARVAAAERRGVRLGDVADGCRVRADGVTLAWRLTSPDARLADGLAPFLIDWGRSPHPAADAPAGASLAALRGEHPTPGAARALLRALGVALPVAIGPAPALVATVATARGLVTLR